MKYSAEAIGRDIAHLHTKEKGPGLLARHEQNPTSALHLVELLPAIEAAYSAGEAGNEQAQLVDREASGVEHQPLQIPWACDVRTRQVSYRYPPADYRIELAREGAENQPYDPQADPLGQARTDNALVRLYRQVARRLNETPQKAIKPRQSHANRPWMVNQPCSVCGEPIYRDQPIWWVPGTNEVSCREHERLTA